MIEKIQISDASIAEEVRKQMGVATTGDKGLMPIVRGVNPFRLYIALDKETEKALSFNYGLISLNSVQYGSSFTLLLGTMGLEIINKIGPLALSTAKDTPGKLNIYKATESTLVIQNKSSDQFRFYISLL